MNKTLRIAIDAARAGGDILSEKFETSLKTKQKEDESFVTEADEASESKIIEIIKHVYPDHGILGEESGADESDSAYRWIIDPLDGTANFMNGIPIFSVSVALEYAGQITTGAVYNPVTNSLFYAERGEGAFWNDESIRVSQNKEKNVIVTLGKSTEKIDRDRMNLLFVDLQEKGIRTRHLGSAALEMAYLARGGTEGYINLGTQIWDYAAGIILLQEAGGHITNLDGSEWTGDSDHFVASNGLIHDTLIEQTKEL